VSEAISWVGENYFELIASGIGFVAIFLQIKQNVWYWLVSIIMVSMYVYIYIDAKLYADMSLQVYYLVISFYGWYMWLFGNKTNLKHSELHVSQVSKKLIWVLVFLGIFLFFIIVWVLMTYTNSDLPYWDSFTTALFTKIFTQRQFCFYF